MKPNLYKVLAYFAGLLLCTLILLLFNSDKLIAVICIGGILVCLVEGAIELMILIKKLISKKLRKGRPFEEKQNCHTD